MTVSYSHLLEPIHPNKVVLQNPLKEELQKLFIRKPDDVDAILFEYVMAVLDAYIKQVQVRECYFLMTKYSSANNVN